MLNLIKSNVEIGLDKPVKLLHVTDTHITHCDDRDTERKRLRCGPIEEAEKIREHFLDAIAYCNEHCDMMAHTGDLINVVTHRSLEVVRECFDLSRHHLVITGNHEYSQDCGEAWEDIAYKMTYYPMVRRILGFDLLFAARQVGGINLVGIDDSYYQVEPWHLWRLQQEVKKGLPIVLMMHVPLFEQSLYDYSLAQHDDKIGYVTGCDEEHLLPYNEFRAVQQRPTPDTLRFIDYVYSEPLIRCVLAGHVHFNFESTLPSGIPQLVTDGNFRGSAREITFY